MKTERDNVKIIGNTWEDQNPDSNPTYNKYDKYSREKVMQKLLPQGHSVLDLGCSIGPWGEFFRKIGYTEIYGVDISEERLAVAKKRGYKTFAAHGTSLPFKDNFFDAVVCVDVLIHTMKKEDRYKMIKEAYRVLKPGGTCVYSIDNLKFEEISYKINFYLPKEKREVSKEYCQPVYVDEGVDMAKEAGLQVTNIAGIQFMLPSLWVKFPFALKFFDSVFSNSFAKYAKVVFIKATKPVTD